MIVEPPLLDVAIEFHYIVRDDVVILVARKFAGNVVGGVFTLIF